MKKFFKKNQNFFQKKSKIFSKKHQKFFQKKGKVFAKIFVSKKIKHFFLKKNQKFLKKKNQKFFKKKKKKFFQKKKSNIFSKKIKSFSKKNQKIFPKKKSKICVTRKHSRFCSIVRFPASAKSVAQSDYSADYFDWPVWASSVPQSPLFKGNLRRKSGRSRNSRTYFIRTIRPIQWNLRRMHVSSGRKIIIWFKIRIRISTWNSQAYKNLGLPPNRYIWKIWEFLSIFFFQKILLSRKFGFTGL